MNLFEKLKNNPAIPPFISNKGNFVVDDFLGTSLLLASSYKLKKQKYLVVTSNLYKAQKIFNVLSSFLPDVNITLFPADELIRAETVSQSKEMVAQRLYVLHQLLNNEVDIVITNLAAANRYLPDSSIFKNNVINFKIGESYDLNEIKKTLVKAGYLFVNKIDQSLEFASRGDILDIFSVNLDNPVRLEFFGDELESIRFFDLAKQTSISKISEVTILPANDILLSDEEVSQAYERVFSILEKDQKDLPADIFEILRSNSEIDLDDIVSSNIKSKHYKYYALLSKKHFSIFDYCPNFTCLLVDNDSIKNADELMQKEANEFLYELYTNGISVSHLSLYQRFYSLINASNKIITTSTFAKNADDIIFDVKSVPFSSNKAEGAIDIISKYLNENYDIVLSLNNSQHINAIEEGCEKLKLTYEKLFNFDLPNKTHLGLNPINLETGFVLNNEKIVFLTSHELFNERKNTAHFDNRFKEGTILKNYEDLQPGDYVVHEYQGIGQFVSLETLEVDGAHRDFLKIAYFGGEILYVPLAQFQLVRKYLGKEGAVPRLSHLHSKDWENTKKKVKERINDLANRLMKLYIERSKVKGFAFSKDDDFQNQFEKSFPYELTTDQKKAVEEIKKDMESPAPMDRLLCGDVGFGKTEVAFIAAFKAINSGKQVALLCPTTLLARQHYELALERFKEFDLKIAIFSRLIPEKKQLEYIAQIRQGKIHLVIGTHRLLSKEIVFNDLGLLIVDEEQRFGVEQKERLKELKNNIDVLTLTATPIPRTLQISLLGVRSLSRINTAPRERMPIQTVVTPFRPDVVKELIERELGRNGQVFYLHNNIETLYYCSSRLEKMLPQASIAIAHGKMSREDIENTMMNFYKGEIDVLVCTSIVENGIDVPNANMIIVEDSERYGLAQLYQIKGRVGRSDRIAYAYLMYTDHKILNEKAQKRLKAIQEFSELGSGYKIAQRDLMIRGAGDILGPEQAGFIDSIGLDMYIKLLNEAVKEKMDGINIEDNIETNPVLSIDAYIPDNYAKESNKIELYQEIVSAPTLDVLASIKIKTRDVYGKLPKEVELLFIKRSIDLLVKEADIDKLIENSSNIELLLSDKYLNIKGIGNILFETLIPYLQFIKMSYTKNVFRIVMTKRREWLYDLESLLKSLANIIVVESEKEKL